MKRTIVTLLLTLSLSSLPSSAQQGGWCSTSSPPSETRDWFASYRAQAARAPKVKTALPIPVAFHVLTDGRSGKLTTRQIAGLVAGLNWAYRDAPFSFRLGSVDTIRNPAWFNNCVFNTANQNKIRKRLAKDSRFYINVYSCHIGDSGVAGISTFPPGYPVPGNPGTGYLQGIAIDPVTVGGSEQFQRGLALAHEVGHYLGLFHTFETFFNPGRVGCTEPGDMVDDTPTQAGFSFIGCPIGRDSCPALPGEDDIPNFMNYAQDSCWDHFTPDQNEIMGQALQDFRPLLGSR